MNDPGPYLDYLRPRGLNWIKTTLRVTVAVQCFGAAAQWLSAGTASPITEFLISDMQWSEAQAVQLDEGVAYGLLACGALTLVRPSWPMLLLVTLWFTAISCTAILHEIDFEAVLVPVEQAIRSLAPLGLLVLDFWPPKLKSHLGRTVITMWLLRLGLTITFAGLGLVALMQSVTSGPLLEVIRTIVASGGMSDFSDEFVRVILAVVGGIELALAFNLLASRSKPLLVMTALWGFCSAALPMVSLGFAGFPESLVRFPEGGVAVVLLLYFSLSIREFPPEVVAEN
ncbi:MAG: hypothetical protein KDA86_17365 [Planctomycetaceae bacterium]|nr:hypothetical protein [Planctomycetaceae bacterium]